MKRTLSVILIPVVMAVMLTFVPAPQAAQYLKGVWVCSVGNLDFPSQTGLSSDRLAAELDDIVNTCKNADINAIFLQVRPHGDALYRSSVFPWSAVLSGEQGKAPDGGFDPLDYIIKKAHAENIQIHAWINPYRIGKKDGKTSAEIISSLSADNPAAAHPELRVECSDGGVYYDPASERARKLICDGVSEILENYPVDGIHFDDYFYPYGVTDFPDEAAFAASGYADIGDFRRDNVNKLVKSVYELVRNSGKHAVFGISPFGIWDNASSDPDGSATSGMSSRREIFADTKAWIEQGIVDYICPQIYWSFEKPEAPFGKLTDWWSALCARCSVPLYVGHALYKLGGAERGFESISQLERQINYAKEKGASGSVFFRYGNIKADTLGCASVISGKTVEAKPLQYVETPAVSGGSLRITGPSNGYKTTGSHISVTGVADPSSPLTVDGKAIEMTEHGYFAVYLALSKGANSFTFKNGDVSRTVTYHRTASGSSRELADGVFVKDSAYPYGDCAFSGGETVSFSVSAAAGSKVFVRLLGAETEMRPAETSGSVVRYTASVSLPNAFCGDIKGNYVFVSQGAEYGGGSFTVLDKALTLYTQSECYVFDGPSGSGSMMDNYQQPVGAKVRATALVDGWYRLTSGKWISSENVAETPPEPTELDIDESKYVKADFTFDKLPSFQPRVSENGTLVIDLYGAGDAEIEVQSARVHAELVGGARRTAVLSLESGSVDGYYIHPHENKLSVWLYAGQSGGLAGKTVAIDPGHGGTDRGAAGPAGEQGVCEDDLNLSMSLLLAEKLRAKGASVYLTRTDGSTVPLAGRAGMIRSSHPDVSVSIHHNATTREADFNAASGVLTLYSRETAASLVKRISTRLANGTQLESKSRTQSLNVCRDYRYPCVLLECGYVCNPREYELLLTREYKETVCDNIVSALEDYFR